MSSVCPLFETEALLHRFAFCSNTDNGVRYTSPFLNGVEDVRSDVEAGLVAMRRH
jgi:hypothetical protein